VCGQIQRVQVRHVKKGGVGGYEGERKKKDQKLKNK
jgi:hypothetical protein